jgi:hypothetical protein
MSQTRLKYANKSKLFINNIMELKIYLINDKIIFKKDYFK